MLHDLRGEEGLFCAEDTLDAPSGGFDLDLLALRPPGEAEGG